MIIITEQTYLEGTGNYQKDIEYPTFDNYRIADNGDLTIWKTNGEEAPKDEIVYVAGRYSRLRRTVK